MKNDCQCSHEGKRQKYVLLLNQQYLKYLKKMSLTSVVNPVLTNQFDSVVGPLILLFAN